MMILQTKTLAETCAALDRIADENAHTCREFAKALRAIGKITVQKDVQAIVDDALRMSWMGVAR